MVDTRHRGVPPARSSVLRAVQQTQSHTLTGGAGRHVHGTPRRTRTPPLAYARRRRRSLRQRSRCCCARVVHVHDRFLTWSPPSRVSAPVHALQVYSINFIRLKQARATNAKKYQIDQGLVERMELEQGKRLQAAKKGSTTNLKRASGAKRPSLLTRGSGYRPSVGGETIAAAVNLPHTEREVGTGVIVNSYIGEESDASAMTSPVLAGLTLGCAASPVPAARPSALALGRSSKVAPFIPVGEMAATQQVQEYARLGEERVPDAARGEGALARTEPSPEAESDSSRALIDRVDADGRE
jgi:hypothetical protein